MSCAELVSFKGRKAGLSGELRPSGESERRPSPEPSLNADSRPLGDSDPCPSGELPLLFSRLRLRSSFLRCFSSAFWRLFSLSLRARSLRICAVFSTA